MTLPDRGWSAYEDAFRRVAERRDGASDAKQRRLLRELGLVNDGLDGTTELGAAYFQARFIDEDFDTATAILRRALLDYAPSAAIAQLLFGVPNGSKRKAESVLRHHGLADDLTDRKLGSILSMMHTADLIEFIPKTGHVHVLAATSTAAVVPPSVFISPETPYGNKAWLRRVLAEAEGHIHWLDKHFMPVAFDALWEAVDGARVMEVQILSLRLADHEGRRPLRAYRDLVAEFANRGVHLRWHTIGSALIRGTHDRWILDESGARNVPNVNAIFSGQHSEMSLSTNRAELERLFLDYWAQSSSFDPQQS